MIPDRVEAGTYLMAAAATGGSIKIKNVNPGHLEAVLDKVREVGASITSKVDSIELNMHGNRPKAVSLTTAPYPDYPTDLQAQIMAMNCVSRVRQDYRDWFLKIDLCTCADDSNGNLS